MTVAPYSNHLFKNIWSLSFSSALLCERRLGVGNEKYIKSYLMPVTMSCSLKKLFRKDQRITLFESQYSQCKTPTADRRWEASVGFASFFTLPALSHTSASSRISSHQRSSLGPYSVFPTTIFLPSSVAQYRISVLATLGVLVSATRSAGSHALKCLSFLPIKAFFPH